VVFRRQIRSLRPRNGAVIIVRAMSQTLPSLAAVVLATGALTCACEPEAPPPESWVVSSDSQEATIFTDQASVQKSAASGVIWFHEKMVLHKYQSDLARADWLVTINCPDQQVTQAGWTGWHRDGRISKLDYFVVDPESAVPYLARCKTLLPPRTRLLGF
jgi:hypothetical protein